MNQRKADLMLHPIRMRIIQTLHSYERLTVQQLLEKLTDVPQATMYRHLKQLVDAELIEIVEEHKVRGTIEKVYALKQDNLKISDEEVNQIPAEDYLRYFMTYQANLAKEFENYVMNHDPTEYKQDGLGFWQTTIHLSEEEMTEFGKEVSDLFQKYASFKPSSERKARTVASVFIPQK